MATGEKSLWLKVLIGFIMSMIVLLAGAGSKQLDKKVGKDVFELHQEYQNEQFADIKKSLDRIEGI
jgi:hypothetical protein